MSRLKSDIGAESAFRGFRTQTLYIVNRILNHTEDEFKFQPEGKEDLAVYDNNINLKEVVQVKNYSTNLSLSSLSPQKDDSFFRRSLKTLKEGQASKLNLVVFGNVGPELYNAIIKEGIDRDKVKKKLKENYNYKEEEIELIFKNLKIEKVKESKIIENIKRALRKNPQVTVDYQIAFDLLMYWIYELSEEEGFLDRHSLLNKLDQIGMFLNERVSFHEEYGNTILPLDYMKVEKEESIERVREEFYVGVSAKYIHIKNNLDVIREEKIRQIKKKFEKDNIVIIHGASGQGKSTLAYRYLYEFHPTNYSYQINYIEGKSHARRIINTLYGISKSVDLPLMIYIDVEPGNVEWTEIVKEVANNYTKFKVLVTIREEDWKRSSLTGADLIFSEMELNFNRLEAEKIYKKLIERKPDVKFRDFEEAWLSFGEKGPLLEFTYLVTQGNTLKDRLKQQIENIEKRISQGEESTQLELLKIVSLASAYDGKVDLSSLLSNLELSAPKYILQLFEKEYLLRRSENGKYLTGLHSIRSKILIDILFDPVISPKNEYIKKCISVLAEEDLKIFILHSLNKHTKYEEILNYLKDIKLSSWVGFNGVINSLLWFGIKQYVEKNRNTIDEVYDRFGYGWYIVLGLDISNSMSDKPINIFEKIDLPNINQDIKDKINGWHKTLRKNRDNIYIFLDDYLRQVELPTDFPDSDKDWSNCGEALFWLGKVNIERKINLIEFDYNKALKLNSLEYIADILAGLYYYNSNDSRKVLSEIRPKFISRFKKEFNVPIIEDDGEKLTLHCIINIEGKDIEEDNFIHAQIMKNINLMRKVYPDRKIFASQGYGHKFDLIPYDIDDTQKKIPIRNLPLKWLTNINAIFGELASWKYRPDNWTEYVENIISKREKLIIILKQLIQGIGEHFKKQSKVNIFGKYISSLEWDNLKKSFCYEVPFPKTVVDSWGFTSEGRKVNDISNQLPEIALNLQRYSQFKDLYSNFKVAVQNFLQQAINIILAKTEFKGKSMKEKRKIKKIFEANGIRFDDDINRICMINLGNILKTYNQFQREFQRIFGKYVDDDEIINLKTEEEETYKILLGVWNKFAIEYFKYDMDIVNTAETEIIEFKKDMENNIQNKLNNLSNNNINVNIVKSLEKEKVILLDIPDFLILNESLEKTFKNLKTVFQSIKDSYFKRILAELNFQKFRVIPLVKGKVINLRSYEIKLYRLLDIDEENLEFFDLVPQLLNEEILEELNIEGWFDYISELKVLEEFEVEFYELYNYLFHVTQLKGLEELSEEKILANEILKNYTDEYIEKVFIKFEKTTRLLKKIMDDLENRTRCLLDYLKNHPERSKPQYMDRFEIVDLVSELGEKINPSEFDPSKDYRLHEILQILYNWRKNLKEIIEIPSIIYLFLSRELLEEYCIRNKI